MPELAARDKAEWQAWLEARHTTEPEVWLVLYKKATGQTSIDLADAIEVALRYGWIDGLVRRVDDERYKQRFTPRKARSRWSARNKETALRLIAAGEMTAMGLAAVETARQNGEWERTP